MSGDGGEPVDILVVDDREANRVALRALLSSPTYRLVEAASGPEALRQLLRREFAVLLIDVLMPEMSGFELAAAIRERPTTRAVPILFLTAEASDLAQVYAAYELGAVDYLIKPLVPEMVRAKVGVFVELYRQRKQVERQAALLLESVRQKTELEILQLRLATERRFRGLADAVPHIIFTARADGVVDYFNQRWFQHTGLSLADAGGSWAAAVHPEDLPAALAAWGRALTGSTPDEFECRLHGAAERAYRWFLCRIVPERGTNGEVEGWLGTFTDIEEQRRERAVLAEFKGTLDAVQDVVLIFDPGEWRILHASQGASDILGRPREELLGTRPSDIMPAFDEAHVRALLDAVAGESPGVAREVTRYRRGDGSEVPLELSLQRIKIDGGRVIAIGRDISDRLRAEEERQQLYERAVEAVRVRDDFLSIASHELRTPLTALRLHIESTVRGVRRAGGAGPGESGVAKLDLALRQVDRLTRLVDDLLDVSRMTEGRLTIERAEVDLAALVRDVVSRFEIEATRAGCRVTLLVDGQVRGRWDPLRLEQIVVNLLSNALKFGHGKPIEIRVGCDERSALLEVCDHGIGISAEARERIFKRFERAVADRSYRGLGLGLYIVERIVAAHGGTIAVASEPGQGARFTVTLPLGGGESAG